MRTAKETTNQTSFLFRGGELGTAKFLITGSFSFGSTPSMRMNAAGATNHRATFVSILRIYALQQLTSFPNCWARIEEEVKKKIARFEKS